MHQRKALSFSLSLSTERDKKVNLFSLVFSPPNLSLKGDSRISGLCIAKCRYVRPNPTISWFIRNLRVEL
jgi:hypothetical protein